MWEVRRELGDGRDLTQDEAIVLVFCVRERAFITWENALEVRFP